MFKLGDYSSVLLDNEPSGIDGTFAHGALKALVYERKTFTMLSAVGQRAGGCAVSMLKMELNDSPPCFRVIRCPVGERNRYEKHFAHIHVFWTCDGHVVPGSSSVMSVMLKADHDTHKHVGYIPYCRYTHPEMLGNETLFAFCCNGPTSEEKRIAMVIATEPKYVDATLRTIITLGHALPLCKVCSWCGKVADQLKMCPCGVSRYCNAACQNAHWSLHKKICTCAKPALPPPKPSV